ncbi:MAG TPA: tetratricopeptide repeat protein, partial [Burkholderiaceae bacterium]|nr:tetratricopeptide repeat protein [Burkholderiaceae bacterium]
QTANPTNADLLDLLARTQLANGDQAGALDTYSKLVNVIPNSAAAQLRLASVHTLMKNNEAASEDVKKALSLQPDFVPAELAQAQVDVQKGNIDQALAIARQIQKQHEKSADGYILEGNLLAQQKKPAPALHAYEQAFAINKSPGLMIRMDSLLRQTGRKNDADQRMALWQKEHPNDAVTLMYLAENNIVDKQYKIATEQLQSVLKIIPQNAMALNDLAWIYQQEKDPRATATAEQALQLAADSPVIMDTLGWILIEQGDTTRGLPLLKKAATLAPTAMDIHYHLASGLVKSGDKANARQELEQLLASGKKFPEEADARALLKQL